MAPQHPEWKEDPLIGAVLKGDLQPVVAGGLEAAAKLVMVTHAGMTTDEFSKIVEDWLAAPGIRNSIVHTRT